MNYTKKRRKFICRTDFRDQGFKPIKPFGLWYDKNEIVIGGNISSKLFIDYILIEEDKILTRGDFKEKYFSGKFRYSLSFSKQKRESILQSLYLWGVILEEVTQFRRLMR